MATAKPILEEYIFTPVELKALSILPENLLKFLKHQLAVESMRARNLVPDPSNYAAFVQEKAHIDGAISVYEFLIQQHEDTVSALNTESR
jgi:hypothetical protein